MKNKCWSCGQSETRTHVGWLQSGDKTEAKISVECDKKISLTGRVSYKGRKLDVHLCLKKSETQQKWHKNRVGGISEWRVRTWIASASGKLYNDRFSTGAENKSENKGASRRVTRHHVSQGLALGIKRGLCCTRLTKIRQLIWLNATR